jgi:FkbM family methyltransferase
MDLAHNRSAEFTKWVVSAGFLTEPFVLIDVGVQGGESMRWRPLRDYLVVHGFDPIEEVVQQLVEANRERPNRHYHWMALGNADGDRAFYFNPANPTASSMYQQGAGRFGVDRSEECRMVQIRRLDTLLAKGVIPTADYIKIDVEGFEQDVLLGARELLRKGVLALQTETNFSVSPTYPKSHFATVAEIALESTGSRARASSARWFARDLHPLPSRTLWAARRQWMSCSPAISSTRSTARSTTRARVALSASIS